MPTALAGLLTDEHGGGRGETTLLLVTGCGCSLLGVPGLRAAPGAPCEQRRGRPWRRRTGEHRGDLTMTTDLVRAALLLGVCRRSGSYTDLRHGKIPNALTLPAVVVGLALKRGDLRGWPGPGAGCCRRRPGAACCGLSPARWVGAWAAATSSCWPPSVPWVAPVSAGGHGSSR
jgi:hypothetical protein